MRGVTLTYGNRAPCGPPGGSRRRFRHADAGEEQAVELILPSRAGTLASTKVMPYGSAPSA